MKEYNGWKLYDKMPDGWKLAKGCGSPLAGYVFICNGKAMWQGGKHALLRVSEKSSEAK